MAEPETLPLSEYLRSWGLREGKYGSGRGFILNNNNVKQKLNDIKVKVEFTWNLKICNLNKLEGVVDV